jgi:aminomethyltransferase
MSSQNTPIKLPLYERFASLGARFTEFAGFEMPIRFGSILEEHHTVRKNVGLFDVSHMGEVEFIGPQAGEVLDNIITNDLSKLKDGQALYTVMCHDNGGIIDDLIIYRLNKDHYLACINAGNREKDFNHMLNSAAGRCDVVNRSDDYGQLAIQGPNAEKVITPICPIDLQLLAPFDFIFTEVGGVHLLLSRTGYTGEDGFELYYPAASGGKLFDALWASGEPHGMKAIGLGARDTLRLEAKLLLYGNDISDETTPLEAGLSWLVKFNKGSFMGRDALLSQKEAGLSKRLRGFILQERGVLRAHYPVFSGDVQIGEMTSGGPSPTLGQSIGLGYIDIDHAQLEQVTVQIRGRNLRCHVTRKPFYKRAGV